MKLIPKKWLIEKEELIEDFQIFSLKKSTRLHPQTSKPFTFLLMDGVDWTNIIALTKDNKVVLIEQQRQGSGELGIELPGGCIEAGETAEQAVERELQEETGYRIERLESLGSVYANPALQSMSVHFFVGYGAEKVSDTKFDDTEEINTFEMDLDEFLRDVKQGKVKHALMVAAVGLFLLKQK